MRKYLLRKQSLWVMLLSIAVIGLLTGTIATAGASSRSVKFAGRALSSKGSSKSASVSRSALPVQALASKTASQGTPLDLNVNSGQDVAWPSDRNGDVLQQLAANSARANTSTQYTGVAHTQNNAMDGVQVHTGFASISLETYHVCNFASVPTQAKMRNILRNLGPSGIIRVGGESVDYTDWDGSSTRSCPNSDLEDTSTITPPMLRQLFTFASSIGWKVIWSVGLQLTPAQAADDATAAMHISEGIARGGKGPLLAIAIGNEPELDLQGGNATYDQFRAIWEADARTIRARVPTIPFFGPDTCCTDGDQWFKNFMRDDGDQVRVATNHLYPTSADDTHTPTIAQILSPQIMQQMMGTIDGLRAAAATRHLPLLLSETNSISNTPTPSVGLSFGQALWAADYLFSAQEHGVLALNFHGGIPGDATSPIHGDGTTLDVRATYYGMLFFQQAIATGGHVVSVQLAGGQSGLNVTAHAIRGGDGKLYVALINKGGQDTVVRVHSGRLLAQKAQVLRLTSPSVIAQGGFQLGGTPVGADGRWSASRIELTPTVKDIATIAIPGYSAALVAFPGGT